MMHAGRRRGTETELVAACLDVLHKMGVLAWRCNVGAVVRGTGRERRFIRFGTPGMSDIAGVLPGGRALFVECKTQRGKLTADQQAFLAAMRGQGAAAFVVRELRDLLVELSRTRMGSGQRSAVSGQPDGNTPHRGEGWRGPLP